MWLRERGGNSISDLTKRWKLLERKRAVRSTGQPLLCHPVLLAHKVLADPVAPSGLLRVPAQAFTGESAAQARIWRRWRWCYYGRATRAPRFMVQSCIITSLLSRLPDLTSIYLVGSIKSSLLVRWFVGIRIKPLRTHLGHRDGARRQP